MAIPIAYFRSSSFNTHRMCPQQYFIEYCLGYRQQSNKKADKGTIVHKTLEICGACKKAFQDGETYIEDDIVGKIHTHNYDEKYLDKIMTKVYDYYTTGITHHSWTRADCNDCRRWTWKALRYNDGMFDPRNRLVVAPEIHFDFEIQEDWAKYAYDTPEGRLEGQLALKGTIDLVTEVDPSSYEMIDWKTGQRKDWATDSVKTEPLLYKDAQLRLYHLAMVNLFPNISTFMVTIFFINDGGPFTLLFEEKDIPKTLEMIRKRYESIRKTVCPRLNRSWKCTKFCHFGKNTFIGTHIKPRIEERPYQRTRYGKPMTMCEQIKFETEQHSIDWVVKNMTSPDHSISKYKNPGELE